MAREVPTASITRLDFACPHCGAHAGQKWFACFADELNPSRPLPYIPDPVAMRAKSSFGSQEERTTWVNELIPWAEKLALGEPSFESLAQTRYVRHQVDNVHFSRCFTCRKVAVWLRDKLLYPASRFGTEPSPDLPDHIRRDFEEARLILDQSPRGAAALLRLAVQKLCAELGEKGKNIDEDITSLVAKGLDPTVQEALDAVRVIGNNAVHPGQMDLRDDRDTAAELFELVNFIVAQTITRRKQIATIYAKLPPERRAAIEERNAKAAARGRSTDSDQTP